MTHFNDVNEFVHHIEHLLTEALTPLKLTVRDHSPRHANHYEPSGAVSISHLYVAISSEAFQGLSRVQQHQLVYKVLTPFDFHSIEIQIIPLSSAT